MDRPRIIVIDDEADVASYLAAALEDEGFDAVAFTDAADGLAEIERATPDLVCLDLLMPERTGLWLYRRIRSRAELAEVPVVVVTGIALERGLASLTTPADDEPVPEPDAWIEKPVDLGELVTDIRRLIAAATRGAS